jgi:hypothetical protein
MKQITGETMRIRVDDNAKMDHLTAGDKVKAYVSDDGYASTIQRVGRLAGQMEYERVVESRPSI